MKLIDKISKALFEPKNILSLVVFRIAFGAIMLWEVVRYFEKDWIRTYWMKPDFNFTYEWFEWVKPWGGEGMIFHFYLLGILSVLIMLGLFYRLATVLMFFAFSYVFLLEQARYLNHFYLVVLICFLMMFIPAHKKYSLDAMLWKNLKGDWVPAWAIVLLQFQIGAAYFFGGIAKMNYDWLILVEPMKHWLIEEMDYPLIGQFFDEAWMAYFMSWSGFFLDLLAPFLSLFRRTRPFMFAAILTFHFMNDQLFQIGIFPWFMILASTIFFPADWLKRLIETVKQNHKNRGVIILGGAVLFSLIGLYFHSKPEKDQGFELIPFLVAGFGGAILIWLFIDLFAGQAVPIKKKTAKEVVPSFAYRNLIVVLTGVWAFVQITVPLRHYIIPGNVSWTEEGHRFSWHMKLRSKASKLKFFAYDPVSKKSEEINPKKYLRSWQFAKMRTRPYMIHQFAKYLDKKLKEQGKGNYEIRVEAFARLNYRPYQPFINPKVDLSKQTYSDLRQNAWILQLDEKLQPESVKEADDEKDLED